MTKHYVYFYGSTKIICGSNSLSEENIKKRLQLIGFGGIDKSPELSELGEKSLYVKNTEGTARGKTETLYPKENITIVPFRYEWCINNQEDIILKHLEDVIEANEKYIKAESIGFPLIGLKTATNEGHNELGKRCSFFLSRELQLEFKNKWCCFGHYYLHLLKKALKNTGYFPNGKAIGNLINETFTKEDNTRLIIHADAGL
jgi:hypothetical protein